VSNEEVLASSGISQPTGSSPESAPVVANLNDSYPHTAIRMDDYKLVKF
jgi:hypothetical protein